MALNLSRSCGEGELDIQIKVLKQGTPVFFTWLSKDSNTIEGYLVTCPCQNLGLVDGSSLKMKAKVAKGCSEISPMNLAKALHVAEIVTISKGAETRSALGRENHHKRRYAKLERERKMSRDGDGESEVVDEYRFNGGGQGSGRGSSLECGGGGLEDEGVLEHDKGGVLQHDGGGIECGEGERLEDGGGGQEGDGDAEDVRSMSSNDGSDFETDQNNTEDTGEDSGREDATREFKVNVENKDKSDNDGTHFEESIEASDSCKESETVNCEQTGGTRQRGEEVRIEDKESVSADNIQEDKDLLQGGNKRDDMTVEQTGTCA
ncbi:hypothetical protein HOLleu_14324 [Holothuria leucospilota]|uniref:Uncharacterized protein n=1 Tax=Holothuria leucospilota TaxID=206669 RepID=A0A9Q1C8F2_HOLLE|nr:hypothetical protein HOLleu_14324 [Holothuria leucospilota]